MGNGRGGWVAAKLAALRGTVALVVPESRLNYGPSAAVGRRLALAAARCLAVLTLAVLPGWAAAGDWLFVGTARPVIEKKGDCPRFSWTAEEFATEQEAKKRVQAFLAQPNQRDTSVDIFGPGMTAVVWRYRSRSGEFGACEFDRYGKVSAPTEPMALQRMRDHAAEFSKNYLGAPEVVKVWRGPPAKDKDPQAGKPGDRSAANGADVPKPAYAPDKVRCGAMYEPFAAAGRLEMWVASNPGRMQGNDLPPQSFGSRNADGSESAFYLEDSRKASMAALGDFGLRLGVADTAGGLTLKAGLRWSYARFIPVRDARGKQYTIDQDKLASQFPSLLRRLNALTPEVSGVEVSFDGHPVNDFGKKDVRVRLPGTLIVLGAPGGAPELGTAVMPDWSSLTIDRKSADVQAWRALNGASCPNVVLQGLRLPVEELVEIAKLQEKYEQEGGKLDKEFALLDQGLGKAAPAPYARGGELGKPYEAQPRDVEGVRTKDGIALKSRGKTVFESRDYYAIDPIGKGNRHFKVRPRNGQGVEILDQRGTRVAVAGETRFHEVETDAKTNEVYLHKVDMKAPHAFESAKAYFGLSFRLTEDELRSLRATDADGRCKRYDHVPAGGLIISGTRRVAYVQGTRVQLDSRMQPVRSQTMYYQTSEGTSRLSGGCDAP